MILRDINFRLPYGSYTAIVGPNGGGKTTLLSVLLGIIAPTQGEVRVLSEAPTLARAHGTIGSVPQRIAQTPMLFPVSVSEIVWSGRASLLPPWKLPTKLDREAVENAMHVTGIHHLHRRAVGSLSGGERQRVFIARCLASMPRLLLLDEPTTGVDPAAQAALFELLGTLHRDHGMTILMVSHDVPTMIRETTYVLGLRERLMCSCHSRDLATDPAFEGLFQTRTHPPHDHCPCC